MRILVAQMDEDSLTIFRTALEAEGHDVVTTTSGEQAIRLAMEERPDVIVTELVMPIVDGWQVVQVLGTYGPTKNVPILALTSHVEPEGEPKALAAGFARYLTLPIEPFALVEAIVQAGGSAAAPSQAPDRPGVRPRRHRKRRDQSEAQ